MAIYSCAFVFFTVACVCEWVQKYLEAETEKEEEEEQEESCKDIFVSSVGYEFTACSEIKRS